MKFIKNIDLSKAHNSALLAFYSEVLMLVKEYPDVVLSLPDELSVYETVYEALSATFNRGRGSNSTKTLKAIDLQRAHAFAGIRTTVRAHLFHFDETVKEATRLLWSTLKKYGTTLNKRSLAEETALLGAMLNEWKERAELDNALDLLHLKPWAAHLEGLNNSFDNLYLLRSTEMGQKKKGAMQARKKEMEAAYKSLCDMLVSQYIIHKKTEPYASLLRTLNAAIQQLKTSMKQSGKRTPRAKKTTTDTTNTHQEQP